MQAEVRRILKWGVVGALAALAIDLMVSGGLPPGHRVTLGLMAAGAGLVTGALLAANFAKHEETDSHGSSSH